MKMITLKHFNGGQIVCSAKQKSITAGKKWLNDNGYLQCPNPRYYSKTVDGKDLSAHYNAIMRQWIFKNP